MVVGNPPWIKLEWREQNVLGDKNPEFAIHTYNATEITRERAKALSDSQTREIYFAEYVQVDGQKAFYNSVQNYAVLRGQQSDLYSVFGPKGYNNDSNYSEEKPPPETAFTTTITVDRLCNKPEDNANDQVDNQICHDRISFLNYAPALYLHYILFYKITQVRICDCVKFLIIFIRGGKFECKRGCSYSF